MNEHRLWVLVGPDAPVQADALAATLSEPVAVTQGAWLKTRVLRKSATIEVGAPVTSADGDTELERAVLALAPAHRDLRVVSLHVVQEDENAARAERTVRAAGVLLAEGEVAPGIAERWRLMARSGEVVPEALRRLHRVVVASFLIARRESLLASYSAELASELAYIHPAINRILRFRLEGQEREAVIAQLEQNVRELSANYAKLGRNAGIFREVVEEQEGLLSFLRESVTALVPEALPGHAEDVFAPRLDRAEEGLATARERHSETLACLSSAQTAITTQGLNVELLRSSEMIALQKHTGELLHHGNALQTAAVLIEFVILFAYTLHSWELLLGEHAFQAVPRWLRFAAPFVFSGGVILTAHAAAEYLRHRRLARWAWVTLTLVLLAFGAMATSAHVFSAGH